MLFWKIILVKTNALFATRQIYLNNTNPCRDRETSFTKLRVLFMFVVPWFILRVFMIAEKYSLLWSYSDPLIKCLISKFNLTFLYKKSTNFFLSYINNRICKKIFKVPPLRSKWDFPYHRLLSNFLSSCLLDKRVKCYVTLFSQGMWTQV